MGGTGYTGAAPEFKLWNYVGAGVAPVPAMLTEDGSCQMYDRAATVVRRRKTGKHRESIDTLAKANDDALDQAGTI